MLEYKLPELGEDIESAEVINVYVSNGDKVAKDDPLFELETDKAALDLPSPAAGRIVEIMVKSGDTINVGQVVVKIDDNGDDSGEDAEPESNKANRKQNEISEEQTNEKQKASDTREKKPEGAKVTKETEKDTKSKDKSKEEDEIKTAEEKEQLVPASPSIRKLARELGIDIDGLEGTGPGGRITDEDLKKHARELIDSGRSGSPVAARKETKGEDDIKLPDFSKWGEVERIPMSNVRRITSENLTKAWDIPHVTQHDKADITELDQLRKQNKEKTAKAGGNLTITPIIIKVVASALKVFPKFNATIDVKSNEIIYKKYINVGFAVDTDRGLLVPNVRNTDKKNIIGISVELSDMSERAKNKKLKPEEMQGGTFSVSNLGGIGGTYFSPIIYFPEVAVLGVSKSVLEPVYENGEFRPKLMMPLSLSYDHRLIDGAEGIRFLRWIVDALEEPFKIIFEGEF